MTTTGANPPGFKATERKDISDLEEMVRRWAWTSFELTKSKDQAKVAKEYLHMNINWKNIKFHYESPEYNIIPALDHGVPQSSKALQPQVLFKTYFANSTDREQEYSFKTERTTRSSCLVAVEKGFTAGQEFSLKLATPYEVVEANAGFKREMSIYNIQEDVVEEELLWGVDSQVKVPAWTETAAELVITEAQCAGNFSMHIQFHGRVLVSVYNMKENNALMSVIEGDIADIMLNEIKNGLKGFRIEKRLVIAEIRGKCHFKYGIEQRVRIVETKLANNGYKD